MAEAGLLSRAVYRIRQVVIGVRPALRAGEVASVRALLNDQERSCFTSMDARDRRHSMDMLLWLRARTTPSRALKVAALLHDVGKGRLRLHERVAFVLFGALPGDVRVRLAAEHASGFRGAMWRLEHHAALGAAQLEGCSSERVRWLVAHHTDADPPADEELQWLIAADSAC